MGEVPVSIGIVMDTHTNGCSKRLNLEVEAWKSVKKYWYMQSSQLGKKFNSKFLQSIFASLKVFWRQKFSCLFLV